MTTLTPEDRARLLDLAAKATPGPRENTRNGVQQSRDAATKVGDYEYEGVGIVPEEHVWQEDAEFIAAADPATVTALLDALAAAEAAAQRVREMHYPIEGDHCTIVCAHRHCVDDMQDQCEWPCPTARAIEGVA